MRPQSIDPERQFNEAVAAEQSGDSSKALRVYSTLLRQFPDNIAVRVNLAGLLVDAGRLDDAIVNYRAGLKFNPANLDLRFGLDSTLISKADPASLQAAGTDLEQLHNQNPQDLIAAMLLADLYDHQQRDAKAIDLLQPYEVKARNNDNFEFLLGRAMIVSGRSSEGVGRMDTVASRTGRPDAYLMAGDARLAMSEFDLAQKDAEAAIAKQADLPGVETLYGSALEHMGNYDAAVIALRKALTQDPDDFDANYDLGSLLYFNRDLHGALILLERAVRLRSQSVEGRYKLALLEQTLGDTEAALKNLELVTQERPEWLEPHAKLSALCFRFQRPVEGAREAKSVETLLAAQQR